MKKRNGKIELLRFIFASMIALFHFGKDLWNNNITILQIGSFKLNLFKWGGGTEFFFMLAGFLMASSIFKKNQQDNAEGIRLGTETSNYIWKKMKGLLPYSVPVGIIMMILFRFWKENFSVSLFSTFKMVILSIIVHAAIYGYNSYIGNI